MIVTRGTPSLMGIKKYLGGSTGIPCSVTENMQCTDCAVVGGLGYSQVDTPVSAMVSADGKLPYAGKDRYLMAGTLSQSLGQTDIRKYWSSFPLGSRSLSYLAKDPRNYFFSLFRSLGPCHPRQ